MSTPVLIGLGLVVLVAVVVGLALVGRSRRGPVEPEGPRTVADLVALRAEQAAAAEPETKPVVEASRAPSDDRPASAAQPAVSAKTAAADEPPRAAEPEPARRRPATRVLAGRRAAEPDPPRQPEPVERPPAPDPPAAPASDAELDVSGDDTPWRRAALMTAGAGSGAPIAHVPKLVSPPPRGGQRIEEPPVWNESDDDQDDDWTGWADWDAVDAEVEAETRISARDDGRPSRMPAQPGGADRVRLVAVGRPAATPDDSPPSTRRPGTRPTALTVVSDTPRPRVEAAAAPPRVDPAIAAAPVADTSAAAPAPVVPPPFKYASPPTVAPAPAVHPGPATATPDHDPAVVDPDVDPVVGPDPSAQATPAPARSPRRPLRSPAEQAAEQAAADLALLRTLGYADPGLFPQSAPVVSLVSRAKIGVPAVSGDPQPLRFRAADHRGIPVPLAAVTLLDDHGQQVAATTADADGGGELHVPRPGGYMLVARAPGHQAGAVAVTVAAAPASAKVVLTRSASVHGMVFGEDGPIAGARVTLVQDGEIVDAVDSGPDGSYRLDDVIAGEYGLSVAAAGCEPFAALAVVPDETDLCQDVELEPALPQADQDDAGLDAAGFQDVAEMLLGGGQAGPGGGSR